MVDTGTEMHDLCRRLFPINRSLTGDGYRQSLAILNEHINDLKVHEVATGTQCFDWKVPQEWNITDGYIIAPNGQKICDFQENNLHVVGYSTPVDEKLSLEELEKHLYSLPDQPNAIPYVTSYYSPRWGFCISQQERDQMPQGEYRVVIESELKDGHLTYGELLIPGESEKEVFLSTYLCHPSMANNELSGPVVTTYLAKWIKGLANRRYTYRIVFIPETIGSILYLSRHHEEMKANVIAGFNVSCVGDDRTYSYLPSRRGGTLADRAALHALGHLHPEFDRYTFLDRGSDERQYCSPGIDLPVCSIMRSKYGTYPEYHTSLDDLTLVTPSGLGGAYEALCRAIECVELDQYLKTSVYCEPQLGKRGLYPTISTRESGLQVRNMMNLITYCDGKLSTLEIADLIGVPLWSLSETIERLKGEGLLTVVE